MKKKICQKPKLVIFVASLVLILSLVQLAISYWLATTGEKLHQLEERATLLEQENKILSEEINRMGSLSRVNQEAQSLGLVKVKKVLNLTSQVPFALETERLPEAR